MADGRDTVGPIASSIDNIIDINSLFVP
jgi:hypothetical protein